MVGSDRPENWEGPRSFGRRMGRKLSPSRQALIDSVLPAIRVNPDQTTAKLDLTSLFPQPVRRVWLEIGFGKGEHLVAQANTNPDTGFIGCEPFLNGVANLLAEITAQKLDNIRIHDDDARLALSALAPNSVDRVFLLHPDPWPKVRHANRRFVNAANLAQIARVLRPGGELRISTDHPVYCAWIFQEMLRSGAFEWLAEGHADWVNRPDDWPETRYGEKALAGNPVYLRFSLKGNHS